MASVAHLKGRKALSGCVHLGWFHHQPRLFGYPFCFGILAGTVLATTIQVVLIWFIFLSSRMPSTTHVQLCLWMFDFINVSLHCTLGIGLQSRTTRFTLAEDLLSHMVFLYDFMGHNARSAWLLELIVVFSTSLTVVRVGCNYEFIWLRLRDSCWTASPSFSRPIMDLDPSTRDVNTRAMNLTWQLLRLLEACDRASLRALLHTWYTFLQDVDCVLRANAP